MKYLYILFILFLTSKNIFSQPTMQWSKCYGGLTQEKANSIIYTSDGGFLCVGYTYSCTGDVTGTHCFFDSIYMQWMTLEDVWIIKTDYYGNLQWNKSLGGWNIDEGMAAVETNGGYVIGSTSVSNDGDLTINNGLTDLWIVKIDYSGNILWQHSYGGFDDDNLFSIDNANDGGFIVAGYVNSFNTGDVQNHLGVYPNGDSWLLKLDSLGVLQWQRCIGGSRQENYQHVQVGADGSIYLISSSGSTDSNVTCNTIWGAAWLIKLDSTGKILWNKCFGGTDGELINSLKIFGTKLLMSGSAVASDGDLTHNYGYWDAWILLTDTAGNKIFSQSYGGSREDIMNDATMTDDNIIIACGSTMSRDYDVSINNDTTWRECWLICTDTLGNLLWEKTYGNSYYDEGNSILNLPDGSFVFAGYTSGPNNSDIWNYHGTNNSPQFWVVKFDSLSLSTKKINVSDFKIYPQPFSHHFTLQFPPSTNKINSISLYELSGRKINSQYIFGENEIVVTPDDNIIPGLYILEVITKDGVHDLKVMQMDQD